VGKLFKFKILKYNELKSKLQKIQNYEKKEIFLFKFCYYFSDIAKWEPLLDKKIIGDPKARIVIPRCNVSNEPTRIYYGNFSPN